MATLLFWCCTTFYHSFLIYVITQVKAVNMNPNNEMRFLWSISTFINNEHFHLFILHGCWDCWWVWCIAQTLQNAVNINKALWMRTLAAWLPISFEVLRSSRWNLLQISVWNAGLEWYQAHKGHQAWFSSFPMGFWMFCDVWWLTPHYFPTPLFLFFQEYFYSIFHLVFKVFVYLTSPLVLGNATG